MSLFLFLVFSIGAVQLFNGVLHRRCFSRDIPLADAVTVDDWQPSWEAYRLIGPDDNYFCATVSGKYCLPLFNCFLRFVQEVKSHQKRSSLMKAKCVFRNLAKGYFGMVNTQKNTLKLEKEKTNCGQNLQCTKIGQ